MKDKCIAVIQKQIIMEIIIYLIKLWQEFEKIPMEWFWEVLQVRFADSPQISKPDFNVLQYVILHLCYMWIDFLPLSWICQ